MLDINRQLLLYADASAKVFLQVFHRQQDSWKGL